MSNYLHGVEVIEVESGGRTITNPSTSVIGIIGTLNSDLQTGQANLNRKFPLNTPTLITSVEDVKGMNGTIYDAVLSIYKQATTFCVVVRVESSSNEAQIIKDCAGDMTKNTGVYALLLAESIAKVKPKILICPYYNQCKNI